MQVFLSKRYRLSAIILTIIFANTTVVLSAPELPYSVRIPEEFGTVKERWVAKAQRSTNEETQILEDSEPSAPIITKNLPDVHIDNPQQSADPPQTVIVVEDAHISHDAQKNIAHILDTLQRQFNTDIIGIEGAVGTLSAESITRFPFYETKKEVLQQFCNEGRISGAEWYALSARENVSPFGIENKNRYIANYNLYRDTKTQRENAMTWLDSLDSAVKKIIFASSNEKFKDILQKIVQFQNDEIAFDVYLKSICQEATKREFDSALYPYFSMLMETLSPQKKIDADTIIKRLAAVDMNRLCIECDLLAYQMVMEYANEKEKKIFKVWKEIGMLKKVVTLQAEAYVVDWLRKEKDNVGSRRFTMSLKEIIPECGDMPMSYTVWDDLLKDIRAFYNLVDERSKDFVVNIQKRMKEKQIDRSVIIAGGYHTDVVTRFLREKNISYAVIAPTLTQNTETHSYEKLMTQKQGTYHTLMKSAFSTLQTIRSLWPVYQDAIRAEREATTFERIIAAELFSEEARRRIIDKGSERFSNVEYKNLLNDLGWQEADLFDISAIYEIGEAMGLVETRINDKSLMYKVFKPYDPNKNYKPVHLEMLLSVIHNYLERQIAVNTFASEKDESVRSDLRQIQQEIELYYADVPNPTSPLFVQTLLRVLPKLEPLESTFGLNEVEKQKLQACLFSKGGVFKKKPWQESAKSGSKVLQDEWPLPIEVVQEMISTFDFKRLLKDHGYIQPEKAAAYEKEQHSKRFIGPMNIAKEKVFPKIFSVDTDNRRTISFKVRYTLGLRKRIETYTLHIDPEKPYMLLEGEGRKQHVFSMHDQLGNIYYAGALFRYLHADQALLDWETILHIPDVRITRQTQQTMDTELLLHEVCEQFCESSKAIAMYKYVTVFDPTIQSQVTRLLSQWLTKENIITYIREMQKKRIHYMDHYYGRLFEKIDTFIRVLFTSEKILHEYGIERSLERFCEFMSVERLEELTLLQIDEIIEKSFLDDFLTSLMPPEEKVLLVNGRIFLTDANLRNGHIVGNDNMSLEVTPINAMLDAQIKEHKNNRKLINNYDMKIVVFLEGNQDEIDLLKGYLGENGDAIDTWIPVRDFTNAKLTRSTLQSYGINPEHVVGVINENRSGLFDRRNSIFSFFTNEQYIEDAQYRELDPNEKEFFVNIERKDHYITCIQSPTFYRAAEALFLPQLVFPDTRNTLLRQQRITLPVTAEEVIMKFIDRAYTHNNTIRRAA